MDEPRVTYRTLDDGRIAIVSLNRPRYRNALSLQTMQELDEVFQRAATNAPPANCSLLVSFVPPILPGIVKG